VAMTPEMNDLGQPVGFAVPDWVPPPLPVASTMEGRYCRLEPLDPPRHAEALFAAVAQDREGLMWTYLPYGPFGSVAALRGWMEAECRDADPLFLAIIAAQDQQPAGWASFLRIAPQSGSIEGGHLAYAPRMQRTRAATEAMYLMM